MTMLDAIKTTRRVLALVAGLALLPAGCTAGFGQVPQ